MTSTMCTNHANLSRFLFSLKSFSNKAPASLLYTVLCVTVNNAQVTQTDFDFEFIRSLLSICTSTVTYRLVCDLHNERKSRKVVTRTYFGSTIDLTGTIDLTSTIDLT